MPPTIDTLLSPMVLHVMEVLRRARATHHQHPFEPGGAPRDGGPVEGTRHSPHTSSPVVIRVMAIGGSHTTSRSHPPC